MEKEFLEELGLTPEAVEAILAQQEKTAASHREEVAALRLNYAVESAVQRFGGRNVTAISALLDMEAIKNSDDVSAAAEAAVKTLKKENGYLFESQVPPPYAPFTGAAQNPAPRVTTLAGALRERAAKAGDR